MLSVLYKLASAAIANRMKPCLDQTKFLKHMPIADFNVQRPFIPFYILPVWKNNKGVGAFYKLLLQKENKRRVPVNRHCVS